MNTKYNLSKKDETIMMRMISLTIIWIIVLIVSLFIWNWVYVTGIWCILSSIFLRLTQKSYTKWYNRVFGTNYK